MENNTSVTLKFEGPVTLFKSAWGLYIKHWTKLVPIFIIPSIIFYVSNLLTISNIPAMVAVASVLSLVGFIFSIPQNAAVIQSVHDVASDDNARPTIVGAYRRGFSLFWPLVWVMILSVLLLTGSIVALVIPAIIIGIYGAFYSFALVLDGKQGREAFVYSYELVRGRWVDVLARSLFLGLVILGIVIIFAGILFVFREVMALPDASMPLEMVNTLLDLVLAAIVGPITVTYSYFMYRSLKSTMTGETSTSSASFRMWVNIFLILGIIAIGIAVVATLAKITNVI